MISHEQYLEYKKLIEEYEQAEYDEETRKADDEFEWEDEDDDYEESLEQERFEIACNCSCGAWVIGKDGGAHHVADCICGAE